MSEAPQPKQLFRRLSPHCYCTARTTLWFHTSMATGWLPASIGRAPGTMIFIFPGQPTGLTIHSMDLPARSAPGVYYVSSKKSLQSDGVLLAGCVYRIQYQPLLP